MIVKNKIVGLRNFPKLSTCLLCRIHRHLLEAKLLPPAPVCIVGGQRPSVDKRITVLQPQARIGRRILNYA